MYRIVTNFFYSLEYKTFGYQQRLPAGVYSHHLTYHNATKFTSRFPMHSTTITAHGFNFVNHLAEGFHHTDYRFQICSQMFTESERNVGGKLYKCCHIPFNITFPSIRVTQLVPRHEHC